MTDQRAYHTVDLSRLSGIVSVKELYPMSQDRTYRPRTGRPRINTEYLHIGIGPVERRKLEKLKPALASGKKNRRAAVGDAEAVRFLINRVEG